MIFFGGGPEVWGYIPSFLDESDPRPAREQFNERYQSGWHHQAGITTHNGGLTLNYPGDPPIKRISMMVFRNETICLYPGEFIAIFQKDGSFECCRMD